MTTLSSLVAPYKKVPLETQNDGVLMYIENPKGALNTSYNPRINGGLITLDPALSSGGGGGYTLNTDGYAYPNGGWYTFVNYSSVPAKATTFRKFEMWGKTADAALTSSMGMRILFNIEAKWTDYWNLAFRWHSSGYYQMFLDEVTASVVTTRGSVNFSVAVDQPLYWHMIIWEGGDDVVCQVSGFEGDATADDEAYSFRYSAVNRPHKLFNEFYFAAQDTPGSEWLVKGCKVTDV